MRGNRSRDTKPELAVRRLLHARGLRYRVNARPLPSSRRTADIVFPGKQIAVFIDGCFWHGCPEHYVPSKSNLAYWTPKIAANAVRDQETTQALSEAGWTVLRYWSHVPPDVVASSVEFHVRGPDGARPSGR
ncbi:very short patch repair endonuclease [Propionibacterium cyclohexanicum]|uniref:very short patch repair endonuclease n=1 Tax=Propionibacterium cyclohexanicum TaxID=64702 RepID=UPI000B8864BE|nr:very short patch repair endonuclease [Propionibacterium cyclohexanicum]